MRLSFPHPDLLRLDKTSSPAQRANVVGKVHGVLIGRVPDRGGRPKEARPPPEMPGFRKRTVGAQKPQRQRGGGGGRGGGGKKGGRVQGGAFGKRPGAPESRLQRQAYDIRLTPLAHPACHSTFHRAKRQGRRQGQRRAAQPGRQRWWR